MIDRLDIRPLKKMLRIFLVLTIISITLLLVFTVTEETLPSFGDLHLSYLGLTIFVVFFYIFVETVWLRILVSCISGRLSFKGALEYTLGGSFLTLVPFGLAGVPLQMYILNRESSLSIGKAGSVIIARGTLLGLMVPVVLPIIFIYHRTIFEGGFVLHLTRYLLIAAGLAILIITVASLNPDRTRNFLYRFIRSKKRRDIIEKATREISVMKSTLREFFVIGRWRLPLAFLVACLSRAALFFLPYPILRSLGLSPPIFEVILTQIVISYLILYSPSPGGSGIAEGGGFLLFSPLCPPHLIGIFVILWRFFSSYLPMILGGIILTRMVSVGQGKRRKA
ncbi:flippase-like domain-containing protein [candidate division WOR-3 bacterium]|nr:flippase-like domain-containing protein [candidate division WOR-3 bacterium]